MYSRKIALSLAKQYRKCPPPRMWEDPSQEKALKNHLAVCPYCAGRGGESRTAWDALAREIKRVHPSPEKTGVDRDASVRPGQLRFAGQGLWRENFFYNPPLVLVVKKTSTAPAAVLVAQTYHDIHMAAPGDLIVTADDSTLAPLFVECWNTYVLKKTVLGPLLDTVPERVVDAVPEYETRPCPDWAMMPRPLGENDSRLFFRELELEAACAFSSSTARLQEMIRTAVPGTRWKRAPLSPEEVFAMAGLPAERLPLAAESGISPVGAANLVRMEAGRVVSIRPVPMEIHGRSGGLTVSGRIHDLPEDFKGSRFIPFLEPEGGPPVSPVEWEWREETGDFMVEFSYDQDPPWRLKAAVVFEKAPNRNV